MSTISARKREDFRKSAKTQLRHHGKIPAVVYGKDKQTTHIYCDLLEFTKTIRQVGRNGIIQLQVESEKPESVMLHEFQMNPLNGEFIHADFLIVNMTSQVEVEVIVNLVGEAKGVKEGGTLQQPLFKVNVRCLPADIPDSINIDISNYDIGDTITVGDIQSTGNYEIIDDVNMVIGSILPPKAEAEMDSGEVQAEGEAK